MKSIKTMIPILLIVLIIGVSIGAYAWFTVSHESEIRGLITAGTEIEVTIASSGESTSGIKFVSLNGDAVKEYNGQKGGGGSTGGDVVFTARVDLEYNVKGSRDLYINLSLSEVLISVNSAFFTYTAEDALRNLFGITQNFESYIGVAGQNAEGVTNIASKNDDDGFDYVFCQGGGTASSAVLLVRLPATMTDNFFHITSHLTSDFLEKNYNTMEESPHNIIGDSRILITPTIFASKVNTTHVIFFEPKNWSTSMDIVCPLSEEIYTNSSLTFSFMLSGSYT